MLKKGNNDHNLNKENPQVTITSNKKMMHKFTLDENYSKTESLSSDKRLKIAEKKSFVK